MENSLAHYGVKGMKWGIRRTQTQLGHKTRSNGDKKQSDDLEKKFSKTVNRGKDFVRRNKKTILTVTAIAASSAIGAPWVGSIVNIAANSGTLRYTTSNNAGRTTIRSESVPEGITLSNDTWERFLGDGFNPSWKH